MSVRELRLVEGNTIIVIKHVVDGCFTFDISNGLTFNQAGLDRDQAHLLMLYLQEHLGDKPNALEKYYWHCDKCKIYHLKGHVCVRL